MYKIKLKDSTVINVKDIVADNEKEMILLLDANNNHTNVLCKLSNDNLSCVQILHNDIVINTYVNLKNVTETIIREDGITIKISKTDLKELVINLRKENDNLLTKMNYSQDSIDEIREMVIAMSFSLF